MKRILMGTTALVAAGAFAGIGATQAQDMMVPMKAGVGGYYTIAAISTDTDGDDDNRGHGIQQNIEMQFHGDITLDNGITAGVRLRINGNNGSGMHDHGAHGTAVDLGEDEDSNQINNDIANHEHGAGDEAGADLDNVSETEVYFKGAFGAIHAGMIEGAAQQMAIWAPGGSVPIGGVKSPWFGNGVQWSSGSFMDEDSTKIVYFSPSFNGISFGVSYAPKDTNHSYASSADNEGKQSEQLSAALGYSVDVMGGSFSAGIGYEGHTTESKANADTEMNDPCMDSATMTCDPVGWRYGATIGIDQIAIGGSVYDQEGQGNMGADRTITDVGVSWTQGALMLGVQHGSDDLKDADHLAFNANYNLGPGVDIGAKIGSGEIGGKDYTQFLLGTMFNF